MEVEIELKKFTSKTLLDILHKTGYYAKRKGKGEIEVLTEDSGKIINMVNNLKNKIIKEGYTFEEAVKWTLTSMQNSCKMS
jgi:hypothetical protein